MFEYEQETYGSKGRERIRAAAIPIWTNASSFSLDASPLMMK